jgi:hypothetical protein
MTLPLPLTEEYIHSTTGKTRNFLEMLVAMSNEPLEMVRLHFVCIQIWYYSKQSMKCFLPLNNYKSDDGAYFEVMSNKFNIDLICTSFLLKNVVMLIIFCNIFRIAVSKHIFPQLGFEPIFTRPWTELHFIVGLHYLKTKLTRQESEC